MHKLIMNDLQTLPRVIFIKAFSSGYINMQNDDIVDKKKKEKKLHPIIYFV